MQRSFSVVEDDDDEVALPLEENWNEEGAKKKSFDSINSEEQGETLKNSIKSNLLNPNKILAQENEKSPLNQESNSSKLASNNAGSTKIGLEKFPKKIDQLSSDSEDSDNEEKNKIAGEYDPKQYENLEINDEIKELFQYITKYIPQQLNLDYKFKPFIPEFLPAVGDIDAFLKVVPPEINLNGEKYDEKSLKLGLVVLDEPSTNQSDPALLYLKMKAMLGEPGKKDNDQVVVKKIEDLEKNGKIIEKWIKDISDLHKSKSSPVVRYTEPMPDLDDLMQQWPDEMETKLKTQGFPKPGDSSLSEYIDKVCDFFQIPVGKKKIQSLHLLFCLYAAIKQTQLYQASAVNEKPGGYQAAKKEADQLVLE